MTGRPEPDPDYDKRFDRPHPHTKRVDCRHCQGVGGSPHRKCHDCGGKGYRDVEVEE